MNIDYHIAFTIIAGERSRKAFTQFAERMRGTEMTIFPVSEQTYNELYARLESERFEKEKTANPESFKDINARKQQARLEKAENEKELKRQCYQGS